MRAFIEITIDNGKIDDERDVLAVSDGIYEVEMSGAIPEDAVAMLTAALDEASGALAQKDLD